MKQASDHNLEIRRLFEELAQAYAQAAMAAGDGQPTLVTAGGAASGFAAESRKAAAIIAKIRALEAL